MHTTFLKSLATASGPLATVCLDVTHVSEDAARQLELKARAVTEQLTEQGAPEPAARTIADTLLTGNDDADAGQWRGRAVVADAEGNLLLDQGLTDPPVREVVEWAAVPDLLPVLRQLPARLPHVIAVVDRVGADVEVIGESGTVTEQSVDGETQFVHKVRVGGWSHLRYQHSSEEVWRRNAERAAAAIDRAARDVGARFVLVAGDERARRFVVEHLSPDVVELVVQTDVGGRAAGADLGAVHEHAAVLVAEHSAREDAEALERLQSGLHNGIAAVGTDAVLDALRQGRVELLLAADSGIGGEVLTGPGAFELGLKAEELAAMGVRESHRVPAEAALLRAAVAEDADVVVVPSSTLPNGTPVAAVLRYADVPAADLAR